MKSSVRQIGYWYLLAVLGYATLPSDAGAPTAAKPKPQIPWVRHQGAALAKGVIVFVHGVMGDARSSWSNGDAYWPSLLIGDHAFDGQDIYVYEYPSPRFGHSFTVDEVAENLRLRVSSDGVLGYNRISFVSHSMGGVVTRAFILKYQRLVVPKIQLLYFLATPTAGSPLRAWLVSSARTNNSEMCIRCVRARIPISRRLQEIGAMRS